LTCTSGAVGMRTAIFWNPLSWKKFIQPILKEDAALVHEHGAKFGYIITSSAMPLIEAIIEAGVDVIIGVDPCEYDLHVRLSWQMAGCACGAASTVT